MKSLHGLMNHIAVTWVCDERRYPELAGKNPDERRNFLLKHSLLHMTKTSAKIAAVCEEFDHNGRSAAADHFAVREAAVKMFVNALKLAEEAGVTAEELLEMAPKYVS